jgi:hypothetical protein
MPYRVAVRGIEQNPSFLGATGKRSIHHFLKNQRKELRLLKATWLKKD